MRYVNGIPMAFELSAYVGTEKEDKELAPAVKFKNYTERSEYDDDGCEEINFDVEDECEASIYINGKFVFGPIKGSCSVTIK